jgi:hypothetical protein
VGGELTIVITVSLHPGNEKGAASDSNPYTLRMVEKSKAWIGRSIGIIIPF